MSLRKGIAFLLLLAPFLASAQSKTGASISWSTVEAESMLTNGQILGPTYGPYQVETESSGQRCVKIKGKQYLEFKAPFKANSLITRYSLPDTTVGGGTTAILIISKNGDLVKELGITSKYAHLYGKYPFTNDPKGEAHRNFYDEVRVKDLEIEKGDVIRFQLKKDKASTADHCIIDLVDIENITPELSKPEQAIALTDTAIIGKTVPKDYSAALKKCISIATETGQPIWIPTGTYQLSEDIIIPDNIIIKGSGIWRSTFVGSESLYTDATKRVRLKGNGSNIHLSDFSIIGKLNYRNDNESNDGIVGSFGSGSSISNIWIEHTKVGIWVENSSDLIVEGCRFRNTIADGINFCVGITHSTIKNCSARGTGDDCFAIWPAAFMEQNYAPGHNLITNCTGELPFLANGVAVYGAQSNSVQNCFFKDISPGSAILISTTFPTSDSSRNIDNNFTGMTKVTNCSITTSGGFDHTWDWRGAIEICLDKKDIDGLWLENIQITNSLSNAINIRANTDDRINSALTKSTFKNITIANVGLGEQASHELWISPAARGELTIDTEKKMQVKNEGDGFEVK